MYVCMYLSYNQVETKSQIIHEVLFIAFSHCSSQQILIHFIMYSISTQVPSILMLYIHYTFLFLLFHVDFFLFFFFISNSIALSFSFTLSYLFVCSTNNVVMKRHENSRQIENTYSSLPTLFFSSLDFFIYISSLSDTMMNEI